MLQEERKREGGGAEAGLIREHIEEKRTGLRKTGGAESDKKGNCLVNDGEE